MASRYFLAICAIVLFAAVVSIHAQSQPESVNVDENDIDDSSFDIDSSIEDKNWFKKKILKKVLKVLEKALKGVAKHCLEPAAKHCKKYWYNPSKIVDCAKQYAATQCLGG